MIGFAVVAASCVTDEVADREQATETAEPAAPTTAPPPTTTTSAATTTTSVDDIRLVESENQPTELRLAPGWRTVADLDEDFLVRSLVEVEDLLFVVSGEIGGSYPVEAQSLYVINQDADDQTLVPWAEPEIVGDVANIDGVVVVLSPNGLWRIDPMSLDWSKAADGDWSDAVPFDDQLARLDGVRWTPATGVEDMAAAPFGELRATASWVGLDDDLFVLDRGFWQYAATADEWRELPRPSLASAAMTITRIGDAVAVADYLMTAKRWDQSSERWEPLPDLPLRSAECLPRPIASPTFAGFQMCSGIAIWRLDGWVTIPVGPEGVPFVVGDSVFVAEPGRISRYIVQADAVGPLAGSTVPVGAALFDVPSGWTVQHQEVVGETGSNEEVVETLIAAPEGEPCTLTARYVGMARARGELVENRRGQPTRIENVATGAVVSDTDGSDIVEIQCGNEEHVAMMASRLWWLWRPITARWLDPGPLEPRGGHSVIWSGDEMIVWGGRTDENTSSMYGDGAAYDPATQTWRSIAATELSPRYDHIAAWTGTEMLIIGGADGLNGAAYDPATDDWRALPDAPFAVNRNAGWAWSSDQLVVWQTRTDLVAAFNPDDNQWIELEPTGIRSDEGVLRSGQGRVVAVAVATESDSQLQATVLDELIGTWRPLPNLDIEGAFPPSTRDLITKASVRNGRLLVWNSTGLSAATSLVDPEWQQLDAIVVDACEGTGEPVDQGGLLIAISWCGTDAVFDDADLSWHSIQLLGQGDRSTTVWTGNELLSWGDTCCYGTGGARFTIDPWRWTPPPGFAGVNE